METQMRALLVWSSLVLINICGAGSSAASNTAGPVRIAIQCETTGRTKACPTFLLGFVEGNQVFLSSPRASADVVLYVSSQEVALLDRVHLRFVGSVAGAPPLVEIDVDLDSRADDDTLLAQLEPAFHRGISLYVAAHHPDAVKIAVVQPQSTVVARPITTPWGASLSLSGSGAYTNQYQSLESSTKLGVSRLSARSRVEASITASAGLNRQPPLEVDGRRISLDTNQWKIGGSAKWAWLLDDTWSIGGIVQGSKDDPDGRYRYEGSAYTGLEWDGYRADDPRGNRIAAHYVVGYRVADYYVPNVLGERFVTWPEHGINASTSVRKDKISIGVSMFVFAMMFHPMRRYVISANPFIEWRIGDHVDLKLSIAIANRAQPAPDLSLIPADDYARRSRLSYADPFSANGSLSLLVHWDRTNGARNDRFDDL
jgi:hypothetical protein